MRALLFLFIISGICYADEPEIIDYSNSDSTIEDFTLMTGTTIKISCKDGASMGVKLSDRNPQGNWITDEEVTCTKDVADDETEP